MYTSLRLKIRMVHCFSILRNLNFPPIAFESLSAISICFARVSPSDKFTIFSLKNCTLRPVSYT